MSVEDKKEEQLASAAQQLGIEVEEARRLSDSLVRLNNHTKDATIQTCRLLLDGKYEAARDYARGVASEADQAYAQAFSLQAVINLFLEPDSPEGLEEEIQNNARVMINYYEMWDAENPEEAETYLKENFQLNVMSND